MASAFTLSPDIANAPSTEMVLISIIGGVYLLPPPHHFFKVFHNYVFC